MANKTNIKSELASLGSELAAALKQIRSSEEFQDLQKDVVKGVKLISASVKSSLRAANKSRPAKKIKTRLKRLAKMGKAQGAVELEKARVEAAKKLQDARKSINALAKHLRDRAAKSRDR